MTEDENDSRWTIMLDWFNIVIKLKLNDISQISEIKKEKAIRRLTRIYGPNKLMELEPAQLEDLVVNELKDVMKKELALNEKRQKDMERDLRNKVMPFKQGGIIKIDPRDLKDFKGGNQEDILKYLYKKFLGDKKDDDKDDDKDKYKEDRNHYYI
ncbi:MAG: hypothetical protein ACXAAH_01445 [Promethearchaeota archaeon]|jgi:hypothetical protein